MRAATVPAPVVWYRQPQVQRRVRLLGRLLEMGPAEVVHRGWRAAAKRVARLHAQIPSSANDVGADILLTPAMADDPVGYLTGRASPRGFFTISARDHLAVAARQRLGDQVEHTRRAADAILTVGIELLGRRFRPADPDFDWLADPDLGRLWSMTVLDDSDAVRQVRADVKLVWEVNRHQFLVTLARAFTYSGDDRYARGVVAMVMRWIAANPPGLGVNWASNLEVAIRALSWIWSLHFLLGAEVLQADDLRIWLVSLRQHRDHLVHNLSTYTDPTNHLIGEAAALAALTMWFPEWEDSAHLRALALTMLDRELAKQVADDGVDREQATSYQRFVLDFVLQVIALADRNQIELPAGIRARAAAMLDAVRTLLEPGLRAPRIGDSDDARGLPFFTADFWDFGELLALGSAVLGTPRIPGDPTRLYESALWLGGTQTIQNDPPDTAAAPPLVAPRQRSAMLAAGGYAVLRSPTFPALDRLVFDCGPLGYPPHASHGHADLLSILVDLDGEELLIDPGTFAYYDEAGRRNLFRATRAHNTVEVGGRDQADAFDPFKWLNLPRVGLEVCHLGSDFDYVEAWHDGYRRLRPAVRHRRGVLGLYGGWLLIDWLEGRGTHQFIRWFHAVPTAQAERVDSTAVRVWTPSRRSALVLRDIGGADTTDLEIDRAPYSERYGQMTEAPVVRFTDSALLSAVRVTLLTVQRSPSSPLEKPQPFDSLPMNPAQMRDVPPPYQGGGQGEVEASRCNPRPSPLVRGTAVHGPSKPALQRAASAEQLTLTECTGSRAMGGLWLRLREANGAEVTVAVRSPGAPAQVGPLTTDARVVITRRSAPGSSYKVFSSGGHYVEGADAF